MYKLYSLVFSGIWENLYAQFYLKFTESEHYLQKKLKSREVEYSLHLLLLWVWDKSMKTHHALVYKYSW